MIAGLTLLLYGVSRPATGMRVFAGRHLSVSHVRSLDPACAVSAHLFRTRTVWLAQL
jgi:hypothetical protein